MCKKHEVVYRVGGGCPVCRQQRGLKHFEKGHVPANTGALKRHCKTCGRRCFKSVCYVCRSKAKPVNSAVKFFRSLGVKGELKEEFNPPKKGDGIIEL